MLRLMVMSARAAALAGLLVVTCLACTAQRPASVTGGSLTARDYVGVWTRPDGQPAEQGQDQARTFVMAARPMPSHCDWEKAVVLQVPWPLGSTYATGSSVPVRHYTRDADGVLQGFADSFRGDFKLDVTLPEGSRPTGYALGAIELWFGPDKGEDYAYLVNPAGVEQWPVEIRPITCA